jgi:hypothetical protein
MCEDAKCLMVQIAAAEICWAPLFWHAAVTLLCTAANFAQRWGAHAGRSFRGHRLCGVGKHPNTIG